MKTIGWILMIVNTLLGFYALVLHLTGASLATSVCVFLSIGMTFKIADQFELPIRSDRTHG